MTDKETDKLIDELYDQRTILFAVLCNSFYPLSWKTRMVGTGNVSEGYFIAGIFTPKGVFRLLCEDKHWGTFQVIERESIPKYDGSTTKNIDTLHSLNDDWETVADMLASLPPDLVV